MLWSVRRICNKYVCRDEEKRRAELYSVLEHTQMTWNTIVYTQMSAKCKCWDLHIFATPKTTKSFIYGGLDLSTDMKANMLLRHIKSIKDKARKINLSWLSIIHGLKLKRLRLCSFDQTEWTLLPSNEACIKLKQFHSGDHQNAP